MTLPLELEDSLVDRNKSALYLFYLGQSAHKLKEKELSQKKLQITLKQLKKLSTKELHKHIDHLEHNLKEVLTKEKKLLTRQEKEEFFLNSLVKKIDKIDHKLTRYQKTQNQRKTRIKHLEDKIKINHATKKERIDMLEKDLAKLKKIYNSAKRTKGIDQKRLSELSSRIEKLKEKIEGMK